MSLFEELKRRNVIKMAMLYTVASWVILQIADTLFDAMDLPSAWLRLVLALLILGFPLALIFSWVYEMTPEGLRREADLDRGQPESGKTGHKINVLIIVLLVVAIGTVVVDRMIPESVMTAEEQADEPSTTDPSQLEGATFNPAPDHSVAVLPFRSLSSGPDDGYFADGLTEEILNSLATLPDLLVTARTSSFFFKNQDIPVPEIAAKLGVANVVEGSVRRSGENLRITAQLIRASDGFHLWSQTYDRTLEDVFAIQEDIALNIAETLPIVLDEQKRRQLINSGIRNIDAFIAYQKAYEVFDRAHLDLERMMEDLVYANTLIEATLEIEPELGAAWFLHSDYYSHLLYYNAVLEKNFEAFTDSGITEAYQTLMSDLDQAVSMTPGADQRRMIEIERMMFSASWRGLDRILTSALTPKTCVTSNWFIVFAMLKQELFNGFYSSAVLCDPLNNLNWLKLFMTTHWSGNAAALRRDIARSIEVTGNPSPWAEFYLVQSYILEKDFTGARSVATDFEGKALLNVPYEVNILAAEGKADEARSLFDSLSDSTIDLMETRLMMAAIVGDRKEANRLASIIDRRPLSELPLLFATLSCACGVVFDLDAAQNFKARIGESGLSWPPATLVHYPAKNW